MGRYKDRPKYNVVSMRITDEEWDLLQQIKRSSMKSISEILRDSMRLAAPQMDCFCEAQLFAQGEVGVQGQQVSFGR